MVIVWILSSTDGAGNIFERAVELRETIYWIFTANILDKAARDGDLVTLNQELREALAPLHLFTGLGVNLGRSRALIFDLGITK